jgi:capsular exopolysaccharide synthesis family protein
MNVRAQPLARALTPRRRGPRVVHDPAVRALREERISEILMRLGRLDREGLGRIIELQKETNTPFAKAATRLGLLSRDDIQTAIGIEHGIVAPDGGEGRLPPTLVVARRPASSEAEAFRALATRLLTCREAEKLNLFSIASSAAPRDCDHVTANLAACFAQMKKRTLILDADLRAERMRKLFGLEPGPGLADFLRAEADLRKCLSPTVISGLSVVPSGRIDASSHELLASSALAPAFDYVRAAYDVVIVVTARYGAIADAQFVWRRTKSAFVIARKNEDRLPVLLALHGGLRQADADVFGAALAL